MTNAFEAAGNRIKGSSLAMWFCLAALAMFVIGVNHFYEDTYSSRYGIEFLESRFGVTPATNEFTYWTMSLSPQVGQIVFSLFFLADTRKNKWALAVFAFCFLVDYSPDVWYRSSQHLFDGMGVFLVSNFITLLYFTVGCELFITVGFGLTAVLLPSAIVQLRRLMSTLWDAIFPETETNGKKNIDSPLGHNQKSQSSSKLPPQQQLHQQPNRNEGNGRTQLSREEMERLMAQGRDRRE